MAWSTSCTCPIWAYTPNMGQVYTYTIYKPIHSASSPSAAAPTVVVPAAVRPEAASLPTRPPAAFGRVYSRRARVDPPGLLLPPVAAAPPPPVPPPAPSRPVTRSQTGSLKPVDRFGFPAPSAHVAATSTISPIPGNYRSALADPQWRAAMADEYQALIDNDTWRLVPRPPGANVVTGK